MSDRTEADLVEQQARIRQLQTDAMLKILEGMKKEQDIRLTPVTLVFTVIGAVAALFGAATAFVKFLG